jgi:hypothetical protein
MLKLSLNYYATFSLSFEENKLSDGESVPTQLTMLISGSKLRHEKN